MKDFKEKKDISRSDLADQDMEYNENTQFHALKVMDMEEEDRPRERALKYGCGVLSLADLWAIILRTGMPGHPITQLCRDLMRHCDNRLFTLERMERQKLLEINGFGNAKMLQVEAVLELIRRYNMEKLPSEMQIKSSKDLYDLMRYKIGNLPHEEIWVVFMNRKNVVISDMKITSGSAVCSVFDLKKIIKEALLFKAESIAMCHNHPSGNLTPSPQDDQITRKLHEACKFMELNFLDHLIITAAGFYSYSDNSKI